MSATTSVNQSKKVRTRYLCVVVDITDSAGKTLHHEVTPVSDTQWWSIRWLNDDELLLKSSDVGDYIIRRQVDGSWRGMLGATTSDHDNPARRGGGATSHPSTRDAMM